MRKRDIIERLERFSDDQVVCVKLFSPRPPGGALLAIQAITTHAPWHDAKADGSNAIVDIIVSETNAKLEGNQLR